MEFDKEAEKIIAERMIREANNHPRLEYFVKWKGLPDRRAVENRHELFDSSRT